MEVPQSAQLSFTTLHGVVVMNPTMPPSDVRASAAERQPCGKHEATRLPAVASRVPDRLGSGWSGHGNVGELAVLSLASPSEVSGRFSFSASEVIYRVVHRLNTSRLL